MIFLKTGNSIFLLFLTLFFCNSGYLYSVNKHKQKVEKKLSTTVDKNVTYGKEVQRLVDAQDVAGLKELIAKISQDMNNAQTAKLLLPEALALAYWGLAQVYEKKGKYMDALASLYPILAKVNSTGVDQKLYPSYAATIQSMRSCVFRLYKDWRMSHDFVEMCNGAQKEAFTKFLRGILGLLGDCCDITMKVVAGQSYLSDLRHKPLLLDEALALKVLKDQAGEDKSKQLVMFTNLHKIYDHVFVMQQECSYEERLENCKMLKSIVELLKTVGTYSDAVSVQIGFQTYMYVVASCQNFYKEFERLTAQKIFTESEKAAFLDLCAILIDLVRMSGNLKKILKEALERFHTARHDFYDEEFKKLAAAAQEFTPCLGKIVYVRIELLSTLGPEYYEEIDCSLQVLRELFSWQHVEELNKKILLRRYLYTIEQHLFWAPLPEDFEKNLAQFDCLSPTFATFAQQVEVLKIFLPLCKYNNGIEFKELENVLVQANMLYRHYGNVLIDKFWHTALSKVFEEFLVRLNTYEDRALYRENYDLVMSTVQIIPDEYLKGPVFTQNYTTFLFKSFHPDDVLAAYDICSYMSVANKSIVTIPYIMRIYRVLCADIGTNPQHGQSMLPVVVDDHNKRIRYPLRDAFLALIQKHSALPFAANLVTAERILYNYVSSDSVESLYKVAQDLALFKKNSEAYNGYFGNFFDEIALLSKTYERIVSISDDTLTHEQIDTIYQYGCSTAHSVLQKRALCQKLKKIANQDSFFLADVDQAIMLLTKLKMFCGDNKNTDYQQMQQFFTDVVEVVYLRLIDMHQRHNNVSDVQLWNYFEKLMSCVDEKDVKKFLYAKAFPYGFSLQNDAVYEKMVSYFEKHGESFFYELILLQQIEKMLMNFKEDVKYCHSLLKNIKKLQASSSIRLHPGFPGVISSFIDKIQAFFEKEKKDVRLAIWSIFKDIFTFISLEERDNCCTALIATPDISIGVLDEMYKYFCEIKHSKLQHKCLYKKINVLLAESSLGMDGARRLYGCIKKITECAAGDSFDGILSKVVERLIASLENNKNVKIIEWLSIIRQLCMVMSEQELACVEYAQTFKDLADIFDQHVWTLDEVRRVAELLAELSKAHNGVFDNCLNDIAQHAMVRVIAVWVSLKNDDFLGLFEVVAPYLVYARCDEFLAMDAFEHYCDMYYKSMVCDSVSDCLMWHKLITRVNHPRVLQVLNKKSAIFFQTISQEKIKKAQVFACKSMQDFFNYLLAPDVLGVERQECCDDWYKHIQRLKNSDNRYVYLQYLTTMIACYATIFQLESSSVCLGQFLEGFKDHGLMQTSCTHAQNYEILKKELQDFCCAVFNWNEKQIAAYLARVYSEVGKQSVAIVNGAHEIDAQLEAYYQEVRADIQKHVRAFFQQQMKCHEMNVLYGNDEEKNNPSFYVFSKVFALFQTVDTKLHVASIEACCAGLLIAAGCFYCSEEHCTPFTSIDTLAAILNVSPEIKVITMYGKNVVTAVASALTKLYAQGDEEIAKKYIEKIVTSDFLESVCKDLFSVELQSYVDRCNQRKNAQFIIKSEDFFDDESANS